MGNTLIQFIPKEGAEILLVLFLSFLIGLEREEQKVASAQYRFGGVRTFPLLGLLGYALSLFSEGNFLLPAVGFAVVGAFLWQSYRYKLEHEALPGMTTELSGLVTYVIGALVSHEQYWVATTVAVLGVALLELKTALESFTKRVPYDEILTFTKFLLLSAVILPIVPNRTYGTFGFNPFRTWLVVVVVSAISYGSYLLQLWTQGRGGILLSAFLGGAYSSTLTTVVLAKRAREQSCPHLYSGAMLVASGVMYLRLLALLGIFNRQLFHRLGLPFLLLAATDPKGVDRSEVRLMTPGGMSTPIVGTGFVDTNIKWSINGYIFGNMPLMTMKQGDRVRWYVATLGDFNNAHTPHWHGNTVLVAGQRTDVLVVTSAQMVTADMVPDAPGIWLYHCHISDHMLAGMDARYEVKPR